MTPRRKTYEEDFASPSYEYEPGWRNRHRFGQRRFEPHFGRRRWDGMFGAEFEDGAPEGGEWTGSAAQTAFRQQVLDAHLARSRKRGGAPKPDLAKSDLSPVRGTSISMRKDAAEAASRLLEAALADLAQAKAAGQADALRTRGLSANSGYRGSAHQRSLWLKYFAHYYNRTRKAREALADGPHSAKAVAYMLDVFGLPNRIAAPGYSNHQGGIAIDLEQERMKGFAIANSYDDGERKKWRASWFFDWLQQNAARFGFQPYKKEPWHWEYRPDGGGRTEELEWETAAAPQAVPFRGGFVHTFTSRALPVKVAVFCPKAAISAPAVDVLVYAHGLLYPCPPVPRRLPDGFITEAPFRLGDLVDASGRGVVLVVPYFEWKPGQRHALGRPGNLNLVLREVLTAVGRIRGGEAPTLSSLILAGHSRAYDFLEPLAQAAADPEMQKGPLARLASVWMLDSTYVCDVDAWMNWLRMNPNLQVSAFFRKSTPRERSGTAGYGWKLYSKMKASGGRLQVVPLDPSEGHCSVPGRHLPALLGGTAGESFEWETAPHSPKTRECEEDRCTRTYLAWIQRSLNQILGTSLKTTGALDDPTMAAISRFKAKNHLRSKEIHEYYVGPVIERTLIQAGAQMPPPVPRSQCAVTPRRDLTTLVEANRGDIPLEFLLGWIDVESAGVLEPPTSLCERGYFQLYPEDSVRLGLDHDKVGTDSEYSVKAGIQLVNRARRQIEPLTGHYGITPGSELYWRLVKLWHWIPSGPQKILAAMQAAGAEPRDWESIREFARSHAEPLRRTIRRDPRDGIAGVDRMFQRVAAWRARLRQ
jgi:LAS superfamily LD-carboxypeptidase LdcB